MIELLVVIAIISILAAILFPVFARARENARKTSCLSNMKQIGLGIEQYKQDHDGKWPQAYFYPNDSSSSNGYVQWSGMVQPYVKSEQIFICPSHANGGISPTNCDVATYPACDSSQTYQTAGITDVQAPRLSYIANELLMPRKKTSTIPDLSVVNESVVEASSEVILLAEMADNAANLNGSSSLGGSAVKSHRPTSGVGETSAATAYDSENGTTLPLVANTAAAAQAAIDSPSSAGLHIQYISSKRHLDGTNYLFADGHAKWYKLESTLNPDHFLWGKRAYSVSGTPAITRDGTTPVG